MGGISVVPAVLTLIIYFVLASLPPPNRIVIDGAYLTISNITAEDQGVYSCSAQTSLDSTSEKTQVTVLGK
jgi:hypothetical protein